MSESKLEAKTRQLAILHDFLEVLAKDPLIEGNIQIAAKAALNAWDKPDEPDGT